MLKGSALKDDFWSINHQSTPNVYGRKFVKLMKKRGVWVCPFGEFYLGHTFSSDPKGVHGIILHCYLIDRKGTLSMLHTWRNFTNKAKTKKALNESVLEFVRDAMFRLKLDYKNKCLK